eukprot:m.29740 g.29740  ORF g.29740 m.29740 type:complete len:61 (+) comp9596_c0_seq1:855-1037(+)
MDISKSASVKTKKNRRGAIATKGHIFNQTPTCTSNFTINERHKCVCSEQSLVLFTFTFSN